ncbi:Metallo-dependent phosphatase-like protein [Linnemannia elongata]|nr:Metallo-dependent phosphatase-like protein [Linnemannia elongata]
MVRSKELNPHSARNSFKQDTTSPSEQDGVVIGDSKDNIFYFIQVSDLHISTFRKASTANFYTFLSTALPLVEPAFVVVTGDLTDAKDKQLVGSMQYVNEWVTYRDALEESGVLMKRNGTFWHDLRGNHDCFNVPSWDSKENMFADMSSSKSPGFMFDVRTGYGKYGFIGIDACPKPGPARPYNFFGLFETPDMDHLSERLTLSEGNNHTFVFSHYPVTTTMFGETSLGESFADLSKSFSVYMCGHLHKLKWGLGDALQSYQPTHFLELEVGDMKQNGLYRIMVVDHDMISFTDVSMPMTTIPSAIMPHNKNKQEEDIYESEQQEQEEGSEDQGEKKERKRPALGPRLPTNPIIVVSNPKDSRYMIPKHEPVNRISTSTHIRFLAWTDSQIPDDDHPFARDEIKVEIRIDGTLHDRPASFAGTKAEHQTDEDEFLPLYVAPWNPQDYQDDKDHEIEIKIVDRFGRVGSSKSVFRVDGKRSEMKGGFAEWIMWANIALLLKALFTTGYLSVTLLLLILPKLYSLYLQTSPPPEYTPLHKQATDSTSTLSQLDPTTPQFRNGHRFWNRFVNHTIHAHILRFVHFSTQPILFYSILLFTLMLVTMPHFWGNFVPAAGEQGQGYFYLQGIYLPHANGGTWIPMADTWMSTIWTVVYDLVIFLYYLTLCATPSGYLYSPSNAHRLRPYHRTWYIRCLIFGIWVFRCCSVLMTAELYGPSVVWTGIGTWWLVIVGWLMFMVGWSRSRIERDILLRREDEELEEMEENGGDVGQGGIAATKMARELSSSVEEDEEEALLRDDSSTTGSEEGAGGRKGRRTPRYRKVDVDL